MNPAIVGTSVPEQLIGVVFDRLQSIDNTISCAIGRRTQEDYAGPNRVVAIPLGAAQIDNQSMKPGGVWGNNGGRQLMIRHFRIEWRCHGTPPNPQLIPDFTLAEALYVQTMIQIRLATDPTGTPFHNATQFSEEEWIDQQEGEDSYERAGTVIRFFTTMQLPVYEPQPTLLPITSIATTVTELDQSVSITQPGS
jgi:hypothetical protein